MDGNTIVKYAGGGLIFAAIYGLVCMGKVDASVFMDLAKTTLIALGVHAAATSGRP